MMKSFTKLIIATFTLCSIIIIAIPDVAEAHVKRNKQHKHMILLKKSSHSSDDYSHKEQNNFIDCEKQKNAHMECIIITKREPYLPIARDSYISVGEERPIPISTWDNEGSITLVRDSLAIEIVKDSEAPNIEQEFAKVSPCKDELTSMAYPNCLLVRGIRPGYNEILYINQKGIPIFRIAVTVVSPESQETRLRIFKHERLNTKTTEGNKTTEEKSEGISVSNYNCVNGGVGPTCVLLSPEAANDKLKREKLISIPPEVNSRAETNGQPNTD